MNNQVEYFRDQIHKNNILKKYKLSKLTLFGSFARGENANDIDIYIDEYDDYERLIELKDELEKIFNKSVDIIIKKYANPIVLYRAERDFVYVV